MSESTVFSPFRNLLAGFLRAPLRFPVTLACAAAWAAVTVARTHRWTDMTWDEAGVWQVFLLGGLFLSLAAKLYAEGRGWNWWKSHGLALAALAFAGLAMWLQHDKEPWESPAFYLLVPGSALLMVVAHFLRPGVGDRAIWDFNLQSWLSVLFGGIIAIGLALGIVAVFGGLEILFQIDITSKAYEDAWIVCMSLVWPWQTLAGIPGQCDDADETKAPPRWTEYVATWLLIPLALVYLGLLYAFAAKSLITWDLPRGTVGWMVGGFAAFGLAVWSAAWPFRETGNMLARLYARWFHYALLVPVLLLTVGIAVRVAEYGITERRYALILLTLWLGGIAVYGIIARPARLAVAPAIFGAMLLAGSVGPWGAGAVSVRSQIGQLQALLAETGIYADGRIEPLAGVAGPEEAKRISSIVRYLRGGSGREALQAWMTQAGATVYMDSSREDIMAAMGLDYIDEWEDNNYFSYSVGEPGTVGISGFDLAYNLDLSDEDTEEFGLQGGPRYKAAMGANRIAIAETGRPDSMVEFDLAALAEAVRPLDLNYNDPDSTRAMTLDGSTAGLRVRLYVRHMSGNRDAFGGDRINYVTGLLLIGRGE